MNNCENNGINAIYAEKEGETRENGGSTFFIVDRCI